MKKIFHLLTLLMTVFCLVACRPSQETSSSAQPTVTQELTEVQTDERTDDPAVYQVSDEEKTYLTDKFSKLLAINTDTIAYIYAPGTMLDEPVVHYIDNHTYLERLFDGGFDPADPHMGTVFMDTNNSADFTDRLTWLFGHARGSAVPDHRMFNDVNFYDDQTFFDEHPYVVIETPERTFYYEAAFLTIVPETTAFYRTSFDSDEDFHDQLVNVHKDARTKKADLVIDASDRYLVLSTCREEDTTIRTNLYLRQLTDEEIPSLLAERGQDLVYKATRE